MTRYVSTVSGHRPIVDIEASLTSFTSSGCGTWTNDLTPVITPGDPFGAGMFFVGPEIAPGRYRATAATQSCEWALFRYAFKPDSRSTPGIFAEGHSLTVVDITERDTGFLSSGCGEWTADLTPVIERGAPFGAGSSSSIPRRRPGATTRPCLWTRARGC